MPMKAGWSPSMRFGGAASSKAVSSPSTTRSGLSFDRDACHERAARRFRKDRFRPLPTAPQLCAAWGMNKQNSFSERKRDWFLAVAKRSELPHRAVRVASVLSMQYVNRKRFEHDDELVAWPSVQTLAAQCGMSERSVRYAIEDLAAGG